MQEGNHRDELKDTPESPTERITLRCDSAHRLERLLAGQLAVMVQHIPHCRLGDLDELLRVHAPGGVWQHRHPRRLRTLKNTTHPDADWLGGGLLDSEDTCAPGQTEDTLGTGIFCNLLVIALCGGRIRLRRATGISCCRSAAIP